MNNTISKKIFDEIFKSYSEKIEVVLRGSKTKGASYDKFRNTGYSKTIKNPLFIKAMTKAISANSLILKEVGLTETGALQVIVKKTDAQFLKLSEKIIIDKEEYYVFNDATGANFQKFKLAFGYTRVILFRKKI